jgi:hypothetical protein
VRRVLLLLPPLLLAACTVRVDRCQEESTITRRSPDNGRHARIYAGGCPTVGLAPQVTVEFRRSGGGGSVFAVRDSVAHIDAEWRGEDTLVVRHASGLAIEKRDTLLRFRDERLIVRYEELPPR